MLTSLAGDLLASTGLVTVFVTTTQGLFVNTLVDLELPHTKTHWRVLQQNHTCFGSTSPGGSVGKVCFDETYSRTFVAWPSIVGVNHFEGKLPLSFS